GDVYLRQQVPAQISASGVNAALVAPQLALNAADSSAGKLWQPGGFARFLGEASQHLARLHGDRRSVRSFASMPVVIVAYSGCGAWCCSMRSMANSTPSPTGSRARSPRSL